MRFQGFIGPTYAVQSVNVDCQRAINLYPEIHELGTGQNGEIGSLVGTPGLKLLGTLGSGPIRGCYADSKGHLAIVSGNGLYLVNSDWTYTRIGSLGTSYGRVGMADNGVQMIVVDGPLGYILDYSTNGFTIITASGFPGATNVVFQDGYFIANNPGTGQFFVSGLYDGNSWDAADFATAEGAPDPVQTVLTCRRQLWLFGSKTIEIWYNSGNAAFPFSRLEGAYVAYGCASPWVAQVFANTLIWLGSGNNADGVVWMANGFQPQRISNHAVELAIQASGDLSTATSWIYQKNGHMFYALNLPNALNTWVYDISTGQWHERAYLKDGNFQRHRAECYAWAYNTDVVGDYQNGNIYAMDPETRTDNGSPLKWVRRSPHVTDNMSRLFYARFQIDAQMGVGLDGSQLGTDPKVSLRYSDDFGNSWSSERTRPLGKIGQYKNRAYWDRLGTSRNRVWEVSGSDPVPVTLIGAEIVVNKGQS